jgi:hypothetical protein
MSNRKNRVMFCSLGEFKQKDKMKRGGCIIYTKTSEGVRFCLGLDRKYKELTDFGGSYDKKKDKDIVDTALRELKEESLGLCSFNRSKDLDVCTALYNAKDFILFIPVIIDTDKFTTAYKEILNTHPKSEMINCKWLSQEEILNNSKYIYKKVYKLINTGQDFFRQLY